MSGNWRISTFNGALLAAYFIPYWTIAAFNIIAFVLIHGLYEQPNISLALFVSDHLQLVATAPFALPCCCWRSAASPWWRFWRRFWFSSPAPRPAGAAGCSEALRHGARDRRA